MRNTRTIAVLAIALFAGIAAVLVASKWLSEKSTSGISQIAVAATEISLGQRIAPEMVKMIGWPTGSLPPGSVEDPAKLHGRVLRTAVQRGEPILASKLAPEGTQGGLSAVIAEGRRAITVRVNDVIGVAGFALPGNYVDIIVNTQKEGNQGVNKDQNISKIVLERILVLAVAQEVSRDETKPRVVNAVTLEVTPEQAEKIDLARSVGTLSLVLRNQIDPDDVKTAGVTKASLLGDVEVVKVAVASKPRSESAATRSAKTAKRSVSTSSNEKQNVGAPAAVMVLPDKRIECVGVLNGVRSSKECY